ncbi:MAG: hypothetical protein LBQ64_03850 [Bacteroidales bacterium]|jgi:hypothetical protein|nr:hypothetical protein [Bacteroidales bacterium]
MENTNKFDCQETNPVKTSKGPVGLVILCVLTLIGSGFSALGIFVLFAMYDIMPELMLQMGSTVGGTLGEAYQQTADMLINIPRSYVLLMTIPYLLSIAGAICMLTLRKTGFHLYIVGQILVFALPLLIFKTNINIMGLLLSLAFISLYAVYLKKMK